MPLITGTAASISDLLTAIRNACTTNGWTLSGNVLHKGTCYASIRVAASVAPSTRPAIGTRNYLVISAGNGIDGSNNLTDPAGNEACIGELTNAGNATTLEYVNWSFPVNYYIHVNTDPDEVWMIVEYNGSFYQHMGFGQSPAPGNPGTGNWFYATLGSLAYTNNNKVYKDYNQIGSRSNYNLDVGAFGDGYIIPQPFWIHGNNGNALDTTGVGLQNYSIHCLNSTTGAAAWSATGQGFASSLPASAIGGCSAGPTVYDLYGKAPNAWNQESPLFPVQPMKRRPSSFTSIVADIKHLRYIRIDFLDPLAVIDKSPDLWKVYPVYNKNTGSPDGGDAQLHSGCHGIAVRYDA